jgi:hypothetical protein
MRKKRTDVGVEDKQKYDGSFQSSSDAAANPMEIDVATYCTTPFFLKGEKHDKQT